MAHNRPSTSTSRSSFSRKTANLIRIPTETRCYSDIIRFEVWSAHSIEAKTASRCELVLTNKIDILTITEAWLTGDDSNHFSILLDTFQDYQYIHRPRFSRGGGIAVSLRKGFDIKLNNESRYSSFEHIDLTLRLRDKAVRVISIYRLPPSIKNKLTPGIFFEEYSGLMELLANCRSKLVFVAISIFI